jgi:iron(III) transport system permease protein
VTALKKRINPWTCITLVVFLLTLIFLLYPLSSLFLGSFRDPKTGAFTLGNFLKFFQKPYYFHSFFNSIKVTLAVTMLCLCLGIPMAYFMASCKIRFKMMLEILIILSMMSPPFIGAYSWVLLLGRSGVITTFFDRFLHIRLGSIYGFGGILLVFTLKLYPYIYMYVSGALGKLDISLAEAAENLGCPPLKKMWSVIVPLILPTVVAAALMVFTNAFSDFGTPMMIGEGYRVMPVLVYSEFVGETGGSANFAAALSMLMVLVTVSIFILQRYIISRKSYEMSSLRTLTPVKMKPLKSVAVHLFIYLVVFMSIMPQVNIIVSSFRNTSGPVFTPGWSLASYRAAFSRSLFTIINTYRFALAAIVIVMVLGVAIAYVSVRQKNWLSGLLDVVTMFPMIISGTIMGIMLLLAFNSGFLALSGTAGIMIIAFVIRRMPYTIRSSSAILRQLSPSVEEASISLGCPPMKTFWRITVPLMMPGVVSGLILSWITIINELSSSVILYTGHSATMSVSIYTEVSRNNYGIASALSTMLTVTIVVSLLIFFRVSGRKSISL